MATKSSTKKPTQVKKKVVATTTKKKSATFVPTQTTWVLVIIWLCLITVFLGEVLFQLYW